MQADPAKEQHLLITNVHHDGADDDVPDFLEKSHVSICHENDLAKKVIWLREKLQRIAPERIYLLIHHFDSVAIAALQPGIAGQIIYIHNCDHSFSLGSHIPHYCHIDLHAKGYYYCRENCGVKDNEYWPMVSVPSSLPSTREFLGAGALVTATSGGFEKFESPHLRRKIPYSISYAEAVPRILAATGGRHVHIGQLSSSMSNEIDRRLMDEGIEKSRFSNISYVPSIPEALIKLKIDLYLTSFPLGGGLVAIEVMSAGIPILAHSNYRSSFFSSADLVYPEAVVWRELSELDEVFQKYTSYYLNQQSLKAISFYRANHSPELLKRCVLDVIEGNRSPVPVRPVYFPDQLQSFLDEEGRFDEENESSESYAQIFTKTHWRVERAIGKLLCKLGLDRDGELLKSRSNERKKLARQKKIARRPGRGS